MWCERSSDCPDLHLSWKSAHTCIQDPQSGQFHIKRKRKCKNTNFTWVSSSPPHIFLSLWIQLNPSLGISPCRFSFRPNLLLPFLLRLPFLFLPSLLLLSSPLLLPSLFSPFFLLPPPLLQSLPPVPSLQISPPRVFLPRSLCDRQLMAVPLGCHGRLTFIIWWFSPEACWGRIAGEGVVCGRFRRGLRFFWMQEFGWILSICFLFHVLMELWCGLPFAVYIASILTSVVFLDQLNRVDGSGGVFVQERPQFRLQGCNRLFIVRLWVSANQCLW